MVSVEPGALTVEEFFADAPLGAQVYDALVGVVDDLGPATVRVSKSQVAFRRRTGFCWVWQPGMYLRNPGAEVVVSLALDHEEASSRWKQVTQVSGRRWMHHLEVRSLDDIDDDLAAWTAAAYALAT
ncbi:MAG TPA: DUF5655 domain-containing protein [Nocardioidaceae bacterium]|nr:DUF5655 domain-containing protein [Nocardioidaceae bacterium]